MTRVPTTRMEWIKVCACAALLAAGAYAGSVEAVPVPVGTTPADDLIFNFDFTALLPGAPYDAVSVTVRFDGRDFGEGIFQDLFNSLDGSGGILSAFGPVTCSDFPTCSILTITTSATSPPSPGTAEFLDGIFSMGYRIDTGAVELVSITGTVTNSAGATVTITPSPATPVPEPATLLLLTAAACGLSIRRKPR